MHRVHISCGNESGMAKTCNLKPKCGIGFCVCTFPLLIFVIMKISAFQRYERSSLFSFCIFRFAAAFLFGRIINVRCYYIMIDSAACFPGMLYGSCPQKKHENILKSSGVLFRSIKMETNTGELGPNPYSFRVDNPHARTRPYYCFYFRCAAFKIPNKCTPGWTSIILREACDDNLAVAYRTLVQCD